MIVAKMLVMFYVLYILNKTETLKNIDLKKKSLIYAFLALLIILDTKIFIFNYSFDFLIIGIICILIEVILKNCKIKTNFIILKIYIVLLLVLLLYRGGLWIFQI